MADTYDDLTTLAAKAQFEPNTVPNGRFGFLVRTGSVWSYPGAPTSGSNLRMPDESLPDGRVQAALDAGAWGVHRVDGRGQPDIVAAISTPILSRKAPALTPLDVGTARAAIPSRDGVTVNVFRGSPKTDRGVLYGSWAQAVSADLTPNADGSNLEDRFLVFRVASPQASQPSPIEDDTILFNTGTRYRVKVSQAEGDGEFSLILARLSV